MGIWAEIKHAINSTLGTKEFMPIDKLIKSQRTLGASDSTLIVISSSDRNTGTTRIELGSVTSKINGSVRLLAYGGRSINSSGDKHVYVEKSSGDVVAEITFSNTYSDGMEWRSIDFNVVAGETYTIKLYCAKTSSVKIGASVIDGSMMEKI